MLLSATVRRWRQRLLLADTMRAMERRAAKHHLRRVQAHTLFAWLQTFNTKRSISTIVNLDIFDYTLFHMLIVIDTNTVNNNYSNVYDVVVCVQLQRRVRLELRRSMERWGAYVQSLHRKRRQRQRAVEFHVRSYVLLHKRAFKSWAFYTRRHRQSLKASRHHHHRCCRRRSSPPSSTQCFEQLQTRRNRWSSRRSFDRWRHSLLSSCIQRIRKELETIQVRVRHH